MSTKVLRLLKGRRFRYVAAAAIIYLILSFGSLIVLRTSHPWGVVRGNSMYPTFQDGDLLLIMGGLKVEDVHVGDVVVYRRLGSFICHRVINKTYDPQLCVWVFHTKGDNSHVPDPWALTITEVEGKVILRIPGVGHILWLINIAATTFLITTTFTFIYMQRKKRRLKAKNSLKLKGP